MKVEIELSRSQANEVAIQVLVKRLKIYKSDFDYWNDLNMPGKEDRAIRDQIGKDLDILVKALTIMGGQQEALEVLGMVETPKDKIVDKPRASDDFMDAYWPVEDFRPIGDLITNISPVETPLMAANPVRRSTRAEQIAQAAQAVQADMERRIFTTGSAW